jgi:16S rRNA G966 N2-methylase RsmD
MGRLRVIAGRAHGRRLVVPRGGRARPTSGLVRGAILDMLAHRGWLEGPRIDLPARSGGLGIEVPSRGAAGRGTAVDGAIAAPPYGHDRSAGTLAAVVASRRLVPGRWVAVAHRADEVVAASPGFAVVQRRRHGGTSFASCVSAEEVR